MVTKLSSSPYVIHTLNIGDPIILDAGFVLINGNLTVTGNTSTISTTNTVVYDNIITLNGGVTGAPILDGGIEINRGASANVYIKWNETVDRWQITNDGSIYANISAIAGSGSLALSAVIDDATPALGGNLNLNGKTLSSNVGNMNFQGNIQVNNTLTQPTSAVTNATVLYAATPGSGLSGLYVLNGASANEELITKKRALGFSLLF
jgi:hypothetical protein